MDAPAAEVAPPAPLPEAIARIAEGDAAAATGDRGRAVRAWREAHRIAAADTTPSGRAAVAMAALRLVHVEGNLAPFWREGEWTRALRACDQAEPLCRLAQADRDWFVPPFAGGDPSRVGEWLAGLEADGALAELAATRRRWVVEDQRWWEVPGTWTAGIGLSFSAEYGPGASLHFLHPDLGWSQHRLTVDLAGDLSGSWIVSIRALPQVRPPLSLSLWAGETTIYDLDPDGPWGTPPYAFLFGPVPFTARQTATEFRASVRAPGDTVILWGGISARAEDIEPDPSAALWDPGGHALLAGPSASATLPLAAGAVRLRISGDAQFGDYTHLASTLDARATRRWGLFHLAARAGIATTPLDDAPWWRQPSGGGTLLLRGLPSGTVRSPWLASAQVEVSLRPSIPLEFVLFGDATVDLADEDGLFVDDLLCTAGPGLRLVLPPGRDNVTRIDFGLGSDRYGFAYGVVIAWGDAF